MIGVAEAGVSARGWALALSVCLAGCAGSTTAARGARSPGSAPPEPAAASTPAAPADPAAQPAEAAPPPELISLRPLSSAPQPQAPARPPAQPQAPPQPRVTPKPPPAAQPAPRGAAAQTKAGTFETPDWKGDPVFVVHAGSFKARGLAEAEAAKLAKKAGQPARAVRVELGEPKGTWFRLVAGEYPTLPEALAAREVLARLPGANVGSVFRMTAVR